MSLLSEKQMNIAQEEIEKQIPQADMVNRDGNLFDKRGRMLGLVIKVSDEKVVYSIGGDIRTIDLCNWPIDRSCDV